MSDVLKSAVVASVVSIALSGASYLLLTPHRETILDLTHTFMPQALPNEAMLFLPQAVVLGTALVTGVLGFAVVFVTAGAYFSSHPSEIQTPGPGTK